MTYLLEKVVVNASFGKLAQNPDFSQKQLPEIVASLAAITGQKPQDRPAKKSISGFKIREGQIIGLKVTLRRRRMTQFLEKVIGIVLPRIRDFRGIPLKNVDGNGNLTFGIKEHIVFPEISAEQARVNFGLQITAVPRGILTREEGIALYRKMGLPFEKKEKIKNK